MINGFKTSDIKREPVEKRMLICHKNSPEVY